jgi:uncharacterized protein (TIGR03435 family)
MRRIILLALLVCVTSFAQSRKEFEVASIRPAGDQPPNAVTVGLHVDGSQVRISYLSLKDYIGMAYRLRLNQIAGPDWMASQRFDIAGKLPDGSAQSDVPVMLQNLLTDRFRMKTHREMKEFPVYALEVAKTGLKVEQAGSAPEFDRGSVNVVAGGDTNGATISFGNGAFFSLGLTSFEIKRLDMPTIADMLTRFLDRPVIDSTTLKGIYDFTLPLTGEERNVMLIRSAVAAGVVLPPQVVAFMDSNSSHDSLNTALQKIGLTLESRRAPLEVLVIDQLEKTPTEN